MIPSSWSGSEGELEEGRESGAASAAPDSGSLPDHRVGTGRPDVVRPPRAAARRRNRASARRSGRCASLTVVRSRIRVRRYTWRFRSVVRLGARGDDVPTLFPGLGPAESVLVGLLPLRRPCRGRRLLDRSLRLGRIRLHGRLAASTSDEEAAAEHTES